MNFTRELDPGELDGVAALDGLVAIEVAGPDAAGFLSAQLTGELPGDDQPCRLNAWCSPKGRVLAACWVLACSAEAFLLILPADLAAAIAGRLSMFVLRAKVAVAASDRRIFGVLGEAPDRPEGFRLPTGTPRTLYVAPPDGGSRYEDALAGGRRPLDEPAWRLRDILDGIPRIAARHSDRYLPQMLNLDALGAVSFSKGCFPGQEIVARLQYRGTVKRRLFIATGPARPEPGGAVRRAGEPIGEILDGAARGDDWYLSAVIDSDAAGAALSLDDGSSIVLQALPYPLAAR